MEYSYYGVKDMFVDSVSSSAIFYGRAIQIVSVLLFIVIFTICLALYIKAKKDDDYQRIESIKNKINFVVVTLLLCVGAFLGGTYIIVTFI